MALKYTDTNIFLEIQATVGLYFLKELYQFQLYQFQLYQFQLHQFQFLIRNSVNWIEIWFEFCISSDAIKVSLQLISWINYAFCKSCTHVHILKVFIPKLPGKKMERSCKQTQKIGWGGTGFSFKSLEWVFWRLKDSAALGETKDQLPNGNRKHKSRGFSEGKNGDRKSVV